MGTRFGARFGARLGGARLKELKMANQDTYRAFYSFVTHNRHSDVFRLVEAGVDPNADGGRALLLAASVGHITMIETLLKLGANLLPVAEECLKLCPNEQKRAKLQNIIWNLEAGGLK